MLSEKIAYIKGLAEGLKLQSDSKEGKIILSIIEALESVDEEFSMVYEEIDELADMIDETDEYVEAVDEDLSDVEEYLSDISEMVNSELDPDYLDDLFDDEFDYGEEIYAAYDDEDCCCGGGKANHCCEDVEEVVEK